MTLTAEHTAAAPFIVYYDGTCGFCNKTVNWVLTHDKKAEILFAPLQGAAAQKNLLESDIVDLDSIVVTHGTKRYRKSAAIVRILWEMGGARSLLGWLLWIIPLPIRNLGYTLFARMRYRLYGKLDACRLPQPDERKRFLD